MEPSLFIITTFILLFSINNPIVYTKNIIYTRYVKNIPINHHGGNNFITRIFHEVFNTKWRPPAYDTTNDEIDQFLKSDPSASIIIDNLLQRELRTTETRTFEDSDEYDWEDHIPFTTEKTVEYNDEDYPDEEYEDSSDITDSLN